MTATAPAGTNPVSPGDVVALQYSNRYRTFGLPLCILGAVVLLTIATSIAILRAGGHLEGMDFNAAVLYSLVGYTFAVGIQNVFSSFPFALALGSTRRSFVLGNLLTSAAQAVLVAVAAVALLALETATRGWFIGARPLSSALLGSGDPALLGGVMLLATLTALAVGGAFGSSYVRFGARGPLWVTLGLAAVIAILLLLLLLVPQAAEIGAVARPWWSGIEGGVVIGLSTIGQFLFLRRASVR